MDPSQDPLMDAVVKAARDGGACHPQAVAEILRDRLSSEQRGLTTSVYAHFDGETLSIDAAVAKMREAPRLGQLFSPSGKFNLKEMTQPEYLAVRRVNPELFGLRPVKR